MKVSVKKAGACRKTVAIEVPPEVIAEERAETLKVYAQHARIGFRKGKAPAHVVASKYVKKDRSRFKRTDPTQILSGSHSGGRPESGECD